jgi:hypothetical protein
MGERTKGPGNNRETAEWAAENGWPDIFRHEQVTWEMIVAYQDSLMELNHD